MGTSAARRPASRETLLDGIVRVRASTLISLTLPLAITALWLFADTSFPLRAHPEVALGTTVAFLAKGGWLLARGGRVREPEYVLMLALDEVLAIWFVGSVQQPGSVVAVEWGCLIPIVGAAVFARSRWSVALLTVLGSTVATVLGAWRMEGRPGLGPATVVVLSVFGFVTVTARALREIAATALEEARRGEVTDPLTGAANRRGLERRGAQLWQDAGHRHDPMSLLVVDIDHFKQINDSLGHAEGDRVIREVAALLGSGLRSTDLVVRLGGEEFLVLLRAGRVEATEVAERLRVRIAQELAPVTVSIGVAERVPGPDDGMPQTLWQAVDAADQALYRAKTDGRNRVVAEAAP